MFIWGVVIATVILIISLVIGGFYVYKDSSYDLDPVDCLLILLDRLFGKLEK